MLHQKLEVLKAFNTFLQEVHNYTGKRIRVIRSDGRGDYIGHKFKELIAQWGIRHEEIARFSPQMNGLAERHNRTLVEMARSLIYGRGLEKKALGRISKYGRIFIEFYAPAQY